MFQLNKLLFQNNSLESSYVKNALFIFNFMLHCRFVVIQSWKNYAYLLPWLVDVFKWKISTASNLLLLLKVGGNNKAKAFFKSRPDFRADMSINEKYNSKAAALYRDKVRFLNQRWNFNDL